VCVDSAKTNTKTPLNTQLTITEPQHGHKSRRTPPADEKQSETRRQTLRQHGRLTIRSGTGNIRRCIFVCVFFIMTRTLQCAWIIFIHYAFLCVYHRLNPQEGD